MGKQLNYRMCYEAFLQVAQAAMDAGCLILRREHSEKPQTPSTDLSVVTPDCSGYWFYLPELAELEWNTDLEGKYYPCYGHNSLGLAMIEASYSRYPSDQARLYVMSGFYNKQGQWIARSKQITSVYEKLARKARKITQQILY